MHTHTRALPAVSNATRIRAAVILCAASIGLAIASYLINSDTWFGRRLFHFAIGGMTGWAIAWFAIAIVVGRRTRRPLS